MNHQTKFELSLFEEMLLLTLHPGNIENTLKTKAPEDLKIEIGQEAFRIIREFRNLNCSHFDDHHLERYIQTHQREAIKLLDQLHQHGNAGLSADSTSIYAVFAAAIETILTYIEKELSKYFDLNLAVPDSYRMISIELLQKNGLVLTAKLKGKGIDEALQQVIVNYISNYCATGLCTYQQLIYAKLFMETLLVLLKKNEAEDWNRRIIIELIYLNFNKGSFFTYCRRKIAAAVDAERSFAAQKAKFSWYIKEIKGLHLKPNVTYKTGRPPLSELLLAYIALELAHIEELKSQAATAAPVQNFTERAEKFDFKLPLNLTVPQLALFAQLFIDVGVFIVEKGQIMTVMKFFAANVTTVGTSEMSAINLNKHRTQTAAKCCTAIENILETMLEILKDKYMQ
jgi:hypothetical protein